jgi:hypothetical protein
MTSQTQQSRRMLFGVMIAVCIWGVLLALGAFLYGYDQATGNVQFAPNAIRGLIVLMFVLAFLGGWGILLVARRFV